MYVKNCKNLKEDFFYELSPFHLVLTIERDNLLIHNIQGHIALG